MQSKTLWRILGGLGILFILSSLAITFVEYARFKNQPVYFPQRSDIAGVPVGGLDPETAKDNLDRFYSLPIILKIEDATVQADPKELGLEIDISKLVEDAVDQIDRGSFWQFLWGSENPQPIQVNLTASVNEALLLDYLQREIIPRYTQPGSPITPIPGTTNFQKHQAGSRLNIDSAVSEIKAALLSPAITQVSLSTSNIIETEARLEMLEAFLQHNINGSGFDELVEVYLESMATGETLHFAVQNGVPVKPDIAFSAASTIKIPIMISVLRRTPNPTPENVTTLLRQMIALSENPPADTLMSNYIDEIRGPLMVSEDLAALGMENTFLAGFFYLGAPVLQIFETPANSREDIFLDPDIYNQTVPAEAGQLLSAIYTCAQNGSGLLIDTFPGEITKDECQLMIDALAANRIGLLLEAGLPPEAVIAHKHGWVVELDGLIRSMSDVGLVFTPSADYVLTIFIYDPDRLDFDAGNRLIARLSQTVYNFFNIDNQAYWWFD